MPSKLPLLLLLALSACIAPMSGQGMFRVGGIQDGQRNEEALFQISTRPRADGVAGPTYGAQVDAWVLSTGTNMPVSYYVALSNLLATGVSAGWEPKFVNLQLFPSNQVALTRPIIAHWGLATVDVSTYGTLPDDPSTGGNLDLDGLVLLGDLAQGYIDTGVEAPRVSNAGSVIWHNSGFPVEDPVRRRVWFGEQVPDQNPEATDYCMYQQYDDAGTLAQVVFWSIGGEAQNPGPDDTPPYGVGLRCWLNNPGVSVTFVQGLSVSAWTYTHAGLVTEGSGTGMLINNYRTDEATPAAPANEDGESRWGMWGVATNWTMADQTNFHGAYSTFCTATGRTPP